MIVIILAAILAGLLYNYLKPVEISCDCLNNGTCSPTGKCTCNSGYYGLKCQHCKLFNFKYIINKEITRFN